VYGPYIPLGFVGLGRQIAAKEIYLLEKIEAALGGVQFYAIKTIGNLKRVSLMWKRLNRK